MPRPAPERAELADDDIDFEDLRIRKPPPQWTTTATIASVVAWGALALHNVIAMPKIDGVANVSFDRVTASSRFIPKAALFALRMGTFAFGVFFFCYHMVYEHETQTRKTDGFDYLSDWTILLLFVLEGALGMNMYRTEREEGELDGVANVLVIAYGVAWTTNVLSSAGAWYSFFAFPMCRTLEGVDNYPDCYLEWYRLVEHAGNIVVLLLEFFLGALPMRRRDFGWSILFVQVYVFFCWFRFYATGKIVYVMFDFSRNFECLAWHNLVFFATTLIFFVCLKFHQHKGYRTAAHVRAAGPFVIARVRGDADDVAERTTLVQK